MWIRRYLNLPPKRRGFHLITHEVIDAISEMNGIGVGILHLFIQHTSASLTINENADPDVRVDMETAMNQICPENSPFVHVCEGPDDMPAHVKSSLLGNQLSIPIEAGKLALGTWQGIYLCEHRDRGSTRSIVLTAFGEAK